MLKLPSAPLSAHALCKGQLLKSVSVRRARKTEAGFWWHQPELFQRHSKHLTVLHLGRYKKLQSTAVGKHVDEIYPRLHCISEALQSQLGQAKAKQRPKLNI